MSKKICLVKNGISYGNYGSTLQHYSIQQIFRGLGCNVTTRIITGTTKQRILLRLRKIFYVSPFCEKKKLIVRTLKTIKNRALKKDMNYREDRRISFKSFFNRHIKSKRVKEDNLPNLVNEFDRFVVGSDCVWAVTPETRPNFFLGFVPKEKSVSFSPSMGGVKIPKQMEEDVKKWLMQIEHLSIREYEGAQLVKKLTGRNATVLTDPTLTIKKEDWEKIITEVNNRPSKYILTYVLHNSSKKLKERVKQISNKYKLPVINIMDYSDFKKYNIGPSEFIDLVKNSELLITDSYHGTIFSMIFSVPFIIVGEWVPDNSRFKTLDKKFNIKSRFQKNLKESEILNMDFKEINRKIVKERRNTQGFLENVLREKKNAGKTKK